MLEDLSPWRAERYDEGRLFLQGWADFAGKYLGKQQRSMCWIMTDTMKVVTVVPGRLSYHADETVGGRSNTGRTSLTKRVSGEI
jgi:hypothetical protein